MRVNKAKRTKAQGAFFSWVMQGLFTSIFFSLLAVFIVTMYVFFTDTVLDDATLKIIFTTAMLTSIFLGALFAAYKIKRNGLLLGLLVGAFYAGGAFVLHQFTSVNIGNELVSFTKILICMSAGLLGGVLGVNL